MKDRRDFFRRLGRWTLGSTLGALCVWVSRGDCPKPNLCQDCSAYSGCELSKAVASRVPKSGEE